MTIREQQIELLRTLQRHGVPFLLIGGHAVNQHGYLRGTEDLDVVWLRSPEADEKLLAALTSVDAAWIGKEIDAASVPTPDGFRCASLSLLRAMKEAAGRPKDLDDLSHLPKP